MADYLQKASNAYAFILGNLTGGNLVLTGIRTQFREILCAVTRYLVFQNILIVLNVRGQ